jgi:hypothetical protein
MPNLLLLEDTGQFEPESLAARSAELAFPLAGAALSAGGVVLDACEAHDISTRTPLNIVVFISAGALAFASDCAVFI